MFRDIILVSATDAGKSRRTNGRPSDASAITLLGQVRVWAAEIRERRARKVERIVRRLARLTFHQLARAPLKSTEATHPQGMGRPIAPGCSAAWAARRATSPTSCASCCGGSREAMELARPGSIERRNGWPIAADAAARTPSPAARLTGAQGRQADRRRPHRAVALRAGARRFARSDASLPTMWPRGRSCCRSPGSMSNSMGWRACWHRRPTTRCPVAGASSDQVLLALSRAR